MGQVADQNFTSMIKELLKNHKIIRENIYFEFTESMMVNDIEKLRATVDSIKSLNYNVAIDDFGTGYSSLSRLNELDADLLKVDRSFLTQFSDKKENISILEAVTKLAHKLNLKVIAEGVETSEHLKAVLSLKCDYVQGYYLSQPISITEFKKLAIPLKSSK
jgi:EAL domain-containing protein (putative c-di-GMP-specific phosphodiesterase class I)